jgi:hypothetical protein
LCHLAWAIGSVAVLIETRAVGTESACDPEVGVLLDGTGRCGIARQGVKWKIGVGSPTPIFHSASRRVIA